MRFQKLNKMLSLDKAKRLFELARESINSFFDNKEVKFDENLKKEFSDKQGVFVTIYLDDELAGCIGYTEPVFPLYEGVMNAARGAAFEDPRFPPLKKEELKKARLEISVLSKPELIDVKDPEEYLKKIKIGRDGLLIRDELNNGLLLPQVATEMNFDVKMFLDQTCIKAGLEPDDWRDKRRHVYKFQAQVFQEKNGDIVEKIIS